MAEKLVLSFRHGQVFDGLCLVMSLFCKRLHQLNSQTSRAVQPLRRTGGESPLTPAYECEGCGRSFRKPAYLTEHIRTHTGERPFACTFGGCVLTFKRADHLKRHESAHRGATFCCTLDGCGVRCSTSSNLIRHIKRHSVNAARLKNGQTVRANGKRSVGTSSSSAAPALRDPAVQMVAATAEERQLATRNVCDFVGCGKPFRTAAQLERHMEEHQVVKYQGVVCGFCAQSCEDEAELQAHLADAHSRVGCPECGTVLVRHKLKKHMLIHNPDREIFPCQVAGCDKTYSTAFNREQHVRSAHRRERPFECSYAGCSQRFAFKASQLRHESNVHVAQAAFTDLAPPGVIVASDNGGAAEAGAEEGEGEEAAPAAPQRGVGGRKRRQVESVDDIVGVEDGGATVAPAGAKGRRSRTK